MSEISENILTCLSPRKNYRKMKKKYMKYGHRVFKSMKQEWDTSVLYISILPTRLT